MPSNGRDDPFGYVWAPGYTTIEGRAVLVTALPYGKGGLSHPSEERPVASVAPFAQKNFYRELAERLKTLRCRLAAEAGRKTEEFRVFCNSRLPEKRLAVEAGLGVRGKNGLVIIPGAGSLFVLGGLLFPEGLPPGGRMEREPAEDFSLCGDCELCMRACPVSAIGPPGFVNRDRCLQAYAADPRPLPEEFRDAWGTILYGCGICQEVCPCNGKSPPAAECERGRIGADVPVEAVLSSGDAELRKKLFRGTVLDRGWISPIALKRNAIVAAVHQGAVRILPLVEGYRNHPEPLLREIAEWATARLRRGP